MVDNRSKTAVSLRFEELRQNVLTHDEIGEGVKLRALAETFHQDAIGSVHDRATLRNYCEDFLKLLPAAAAKGESLEPHTRDLLSYDGLFAASELRQILFAATDGALNVAKMARDASGTQTRQDIISEAAPRIGLYLYIAQDALERIETCAESDRAQFSDADLANISKQFISIRGALSGEVGKGVAVSEALAAYLASKFDYRIRESAIADLIVHALHKPEQSDNLARGLAAQFQKISELQTTWPGGTFPLQLPRNFAIAVNQSDPSPSAVAELLQSMAEVVANELPRAFQSRGTLQGAESSSSVQRLAANAFAVFGNISVSHDEVLPLTEKQLAALSAPLERFFKTAQAHGVTIAPRESEPHSITFGGIEPGKLTIAMFDLNIIRNKVTTSLHDVRELRPHALVS